MTLSLIYQKNIVDEAESFGRKLLPSLHKKDLPKKVRTSKRTKKTGGSSSSSGKYYYCQNDDLIMSVIILFPVIL